MTRIQRMKNSDISFAIFRWCVAQFTCFDDIIAEIIGHHLLVEHLVLPLGVCEGLLVRTYLKSHWTLILQQQYHAAHSR